jgi:hypothetical protein
MLLNYKTNAVFQTPAAENQKEKQKSSRLCPAHLALKVGDFFF